MAKYSKVGYGNYEDIDSAINQGILDGKDFIVTKDTSELVYIKNDNTKQVIQARLKRFESEEVALEKLNSVSDTYDGQPVAIKNDSNCYQLYLVLNDGDKFIVNPVFDASGIHVACDNKSLVTNQNGIMSIAGIEEAPVGAVLTKQEDKSVQWIEKTDILESYVLPIASATTLGGVKVGENLTIAENGVLSVDVANVAEEDNTKPITSAAVNTLVGNIDALLSTI